MRRFSAFLSLVLAFAVGTDFQSAAQTEVASGISTAKPMKSDPIAPTNWSFQCANGSTCGTDGDWISTTSEPGTVRLWNSGTTWDMLETSQGTYDWTPLDTWLDMVAQHQPTAVIYTFGKVPCWITTVACTDGLSWSPGPPSDLNNNGSPAFVAFVTDLVEHCSPAGNCVSSYIKYWEMWNEANLTGFWTGTQNQLYDMFKPVVAIIRAHVSGAIVSTPPVCGGNATWMTGWLNLENANGRLSDYYGFHVYLRDMTPETRINIVAKMVNAKNAAGWTKTPFMNTETNFLNTTYTCSSQYTAEDCDGQLVRWHVLQYAYQGGAGGAFQVGWFDWPSITAGGYDTYYYTMMNWLVGSTFAASCSSSGTVWSCPLTESSGVTALIVWNTAGNSQYTPATEYVNYRSFNGTYGGASQSIKAGQSTTIGLIPVMFQSK
jgi:hypothetical protein